MRLACSPRVVRRALLFAVIVGGILVTINHADAIVRGDVDGVRLLRIVLTVLTPYVVSTVSSVLAMRDEIRSGEARHADGETDGSRSHPSRNRTTIPHTTTSASPTGIGPA